MFGQVTSWLICELRFRWWDRERERALKKDRTHLYQGLQLKQNISVPTSTFSPQQEGYGRNKPTLGHPEPDHWLAAIRFSLTCASLKVKCRKVKNVGSTQNLFRKRLFFLGTFGWTLSSAVLGLLSITLYDIISIKSILNSLTDSVGACLTCLIIQWRSSNDRSGLVVWVGVGVWGIWVTGNGDVRSSAQTQTFFTASLR